jgi:hypothetical protein
MTVSTSGEETDVPCLDTQSGMAPVFMAWVALHAQEWFSLALEVIGDASMRVVANSTVLNNRSMLKSEGSLFLDMTAETELVKSFGFDVSFSSTVRIMAGRAVHFFLTNGVMGREIYLSSFVSMAFVTEIRILFN